MNKLLLFLNQCISITKKFTLCSISFYNLFKTPKKCSLCFGLMTSFIKFKLSDKSEFPRRTEMSPPYAFDHFSLFWLWKSVQINMNQWFIHPYDLWRTQTHSAAVYFSFLLSICQMISFIWADAYKAVAYTIFNNKCDKMLFIAHSTAHRTIHVPVMHFWDDGK